METVLLKILISSIFDMVVSSENTLSNEQAKEIIKRNTPSDYLKDQLSELVLDMNKQL